MHPDMQSSRVFRLKVVVRACYGAYFVAHVFKYLMANFVSGRPASCCSLELSLEPNLQLPGSLQLPARLRNYQCTFTKLQGVSNLFDRSVYSQCALHNKTKSIFCFNSCGGGLAQLFDSVLYGH